MDTECYPKGSASWYSCHETICWETSPRFWLLLWRTKAPYCILFMAYDMKTVTLALTAFWFLWKHCSSKSQRSCNKSVYNYRCSLPCDAGTVQQTNGRGGLVQPIHQLPQSSEKNFQVLEDNFLLSYWCCYCKCSDHLQLVSVTECQKNLQKTNFVMHWSSKSFQSMVQKNILKSVSVVNMLLSK